MTTRVRLVNWIVAGVAVRCAREADERITCEKRSGRGVVVAVDYSSPDPGASTVVTDVEVAPGSHDLERRGHWRARTTRDFGLGARHLSRGLEPRCPS
jgi:hypothetical protein